MQSASASGTPQSLVRSFRRGTIGFHRRNGRTFPWRESTDPYTVLIGEVLLQRTRAEHVTTVFRRFLQRWPDPESLSCAKAMEIEDVIAPLGLRKRGRMLQSLGKSLVEYGCVPLRPELLIQLPGVGPYTAHAVPIFARNERLPLVDWVIARVLRRYFGLSGRARPNSDSDLWRLSESLVASGRAREVWHGTLDLAAAVCKPNPLCDECPLKTQCSFAQSRRGWTQ